MFTPPNEMLIECLQGSPLKLGGGDARCDTQGHMAKYSSYSLIRSSTIAFVNSESVNPAEDTIQPFPDGRQGKWKRKRKEPEKEDSLVAVMRNAVQVMETTASNRAFVSDDENDT